jgi:hypothetical protein
MYHMHAKEPARSPSRATERGRKARLVKWGRIAAASAVAAASLGAVAAPALADPHGQPTNYRFATLDNANDLTFNQLLGINNWGVIAGYFGSGAQGHPNQGYLLAAPYGQRSYRSENFPGSVQTQVTGLNDRGVTVGFWSSMNNADQVNDNHGFVEYRGQFRTADFPTASPASPPVDQLLGVNDRDVAVGFYTDANGNNHGYEYNIRQNSYRPVADPGSPGASLTAAAINQSGQVAGFYANPATGNTDGFLLTHGDRFLDLAAPGASSTMALGVNDRDEVVGVYQVGTGSSAVAHGFTWTPESGFQTVDDPNGIGTTTINGVNDQGQLVGFYTDAAGNTDGLLATPRHHHRDW